MERNMGLREIFEQLTAENQKILIDFAGQLKVTQHSHGDGPCSLSSKNHTQE